MVVLQTEIEFVYKSSIYFALLMNRKGDILPRISSIIVFPASQPLICDEVIDIIWKSASRAWFKGQICILTSLKFSRTLHYISFLIQLLLKCGNKHVKGVEQLYHVGHLTKHVSIIVILGLLMGKYVIQI
jgi:hypothetical protein